VLFKTLYHRVGSWRATVIMGTVLLAVGPLAGCSGNHFPFAASMSGSSVSALPCGNGKVVAYARSELYFGKSISGGGTVTEAAFNQFLEQEVTPRFPDGFTVVHAMGQFRESNGAIKREASDLLIIFYPQASVSDASKKLDEIRAVYDKNFHQESVLREDEQPSCVSF
jgi:hypothetical protein